MVEPFYRNSQKQSPRRVLQKTLFWEISQNSEENTCARVSFLVKLIDHAKDCDTVATVSTEKFGAFWNESLLGIDGFFGPM